MKTVKKGNPRNVRVQSTTTTKTSSKKKGGKEKLNETFEDDQRVTDLDTGETVSTKTVQKDKNNKTKKFKSTTKITDREGKLLAKQVDKKGRSRLKVTRQGKVKGYGKG
tara:strand:+ start:105 stop:431 length:327 start_codon:yes stop_codon:yes gene_type:complete